MMIIVLFIDVFCVSMTLFVNLHFSKIYLDFNMP